jgi:hypothetical protein
MGSPTSPTKGTSGKAKTAKAKGKKVVKGKAPPKVPPAKPPTTVKKNSTVVQLAKGKVIRQSATIVNVRMQPMNMLGAVRPMNPNVHTIAIPSQAPVAFPSAVVNRSSTVTAITTASAGTMTELLPVKDTFDFATAVPLGLAQENPLFEDSAMATPRLTRRQSEPSALPPGIPLARTKNLETHSQSFKKFNTTYKSHNSSTAATTKLLEIATAISKDSNDLNFKKLVDTELLDRTPGYWKKLHDAIEKIVKGT